MSSTLRTCVGRDGGERWGTRVLFRVTRSRLFRGGVVTVTDRLDYWLGCTIDALGDCEGSGRVQFRVI